LTTIKNFQSCKKWPPVEMRRVTLFDHISCEIVQIVDCDFTISTPKEKAQWGSGKTGNLSWDLGSRTGS
jgi:hypothetical protein